MREPTRAELERARKHILTGNYYYTERDVEELAREFAAVADECGVAELMGDTRWPERWVLCVLKGISGGVRWQVFDEGSGLSVAISSTPAKACEAALELARETGNA